MLTTSQKVPCTFDLTVSGLGYLEGNVGQEVNLVCGMFVDQADVSKLKEGTKVEVPLWLAELLAVR